MGTSSPIEHGLAEHREVAVRITVSRSGGFAGLTRRGQVDVDATPDPAWWHETAAVAVPLPAPATDAAPSPVRDGFTWTIEVDEERAVLPDSAVRGPLREIAERTLAEGAPPS